MLASRFMDLLGADFYTGVPDSLLHPLCVSILERYGTDPRHHVIGVNEGACAGMAAGYFLATGHVPVIYLQNSGEGNLINPLASLMHRRVYSLPAILVVGWRGEPGVHDEPQHVYQGEITCQLLTDMQIPFQVLSAESTEEDVLAWMKTFRPELEQGHPVAFVVRKNALTTPVRHAFSNPYAMTRERAIEHIVEYTGTCPIVSTTGKASRELFELREKRGEGHARDFLTVGSMGHAASIALGLALQKRDTRVFCLDGDGAVLMHMGCLATIGQAKCENLVHLVINNGAHETVGGLPTAGFDADLGAVARACGYRHVLLAASETELEDALKHLPESGPVFLEIRCALGARADLGRPTTTPIENRDAFMRFLQTK